MKIIHSGVLGKGEDKKVCVYFEDGKRNAEGYVPSCEITSNHGFSDDELGQIKEYLVNNKQTILREACGINPIKSMMKNEE